MERHPERPLTPFYRTFYLAGVQDTEIPSKETMLTFVKDYAKISDVEALQNFVNAVSAVTELTTFRAMVDGTAESAEVAGGSRTVRRATGGASSDIPADAAFRTGVERDEFVV